MRWIGQNLMSFASQRPEALALLCDEQRYTWFELYDRVTALADRILQKTRHGDRIALDMARSDHLLLAFFAVIRHGRVAVVLDPGWADSRKEELCNRVGAQHWLRDEDVVSASCAEVQDGSACETDDFYIGFTSGSTGSPKGYARAHSSWLHGFVASEQMMSLTPEDVVAVPGPLSHSLHLYGAVQALHMGACVLTSNRFVPRRFVQMMSSHKASAVYVTPTQLHYVVAAAKGRLELPDLTRVLVSGAKWTGQGRADLQVVAPSCEPIEFYGASELSFVSVKRGRDGLPEASVGLPLDDLTLDIRDKDGRSLPAGEPGCIWLDSPHVFSGYACGADDAFRRDGRFVTVGDHGWLDEAGNLYVAGRESRMIISAGVNIYPEECERLLEDLPEVAGAALVAVPDAVRGAVPVALVKAVDGQVIDGHAVLVQLKEAVGSAKAPRRVVVVDGDWPRTGSGKTDFAALAKLYADVLEAVR